MAVCFANSIVLLEYISLHSLKLVLFGSELQAEMELRALSGTGWFATGALSSGPHSHQGVMVQLFFLRLLLKSHQVCRNLKKKKITN
jgi:hypothetical protein